jgi:hypothetical protein
MEFQMQDLERAIRELAYHLWVADGCPDGHAEVHWLRAQRKVLASSLEGFGRVTISEEGLVDNGKRKPRAKQSRRAA